MSRSYLVALVCLVFLMALNRPATAQSIAQFPYEKVCVAAPPGSPLGTKALVDHDKLQAAAGVDANKFLKGRAFDLAGYQRDLQFVVSAFENQLKRERGKFYRVYEGGREITSISARVYIQNPGLYRITCENFGSAKTEVATIRETVSKKISAAGNKLIARKDLDGIQKKLASATPATFSATSDRLANNRVFQSAFVLASEIPIDIGFDPSAAQVNTSALALRLLPYIRHQGVFNSSSRAKDVDNLGFGLQADLYPVRLTPWINATFSLGGEYLTDSVNDKEIWAGELAVRPYAPADVKWPIELGQRNFFDPLGGGPSISFDLSGRLRYGRVEDAGPVQTLQSQTEYVRLGYRAGVDLDLGGSDVFSGVTLSAAYIFFANLEDPTGLKRIQRFEAMLNYAFTPTVGVALGYERGRNEDTLQKVDKITAGLTIKFGEVERSGKQSF